MTDKSRRKSKKRTRSDYEPEIGAQSIIPPPKLVSRKKWGALPPRSSEPLGQRVRYLVATINTDTPYCTSKKSCIEIVQNLQKRHMEMGCSDIQYNFLIGLDGRVYEGRGWHNKSSSALARPPDLPPGRRRLDIAFIGDWRDGENPPVEMADSALMLVNYGIKKKYMKLAYVYLEIDKLCTKET